MRWGILIVAALAAFSPSLRSVAKTEFEVTVVVDQRFEVLSEARLDAVLARAGDLLKQVCQLDVTFRVGERVGLDAFLEGEQKRVAPYVVPVVYTWDPFETAAGTHRADIIESCRRFKDLDALKVILGGEEAGAARDVDVAGKLLSRRFLKSLELLKGLKGGDGEPLVTPEGWRRYSLMRTGVLLHSRGWTERHRLYLSNAILIDDMRAADYPAARVRGGAMNGLTLPASNAAVVAYGSLRLEDGLSPIRDVPRVRDSDALVAYSIAQMVGPYLLMGRGPVYSDDGGMARPTYLLKKEADFTDVTRMKLPAGRGADNEGYASYRYKVLLRMDVLLAQGRWREVLEEGERARRARRLSEEDMLHVIARAQRAEARLGGQ